jgi:hypothetical protein
MERALEDAVKRRPELGKYFADGPSIPPSLERVDQPPCDHYHRRDFYPFLFLKN